MAGEAIERFGRKGFKLVTAKFMQVSQEQGRQLYAVHKGRDFYEPLVKYLACEPVMGGQGERAVKVARKIIGVTFGYKAEAGTLREDFGCSGRYNLVHGSDSTESAEQEIKIFFRPEEIVDYELTDAPWVYCRND